MQENDSKLNPLVLTWFDPSVKKTQPAPRHIACVHAEGSGETNAWLSGQKKVKLAPP